jgi:two-component sensor histidine kinase
LKSELEPVIMDADLAIPCGLILNELISNAFKHGFPQGESGEIKVTCAPGLEAAACSGLTTLESGSPRIWALMRPSHSAYGWCGP